MDMESIERAEQPEEADTEAWEQIVARLLNLKERILIRQMLVKAGIHPYYSLINKMQELNHLKGRFLDLKEIKELFMSQGDKLAEEILKGLKKGKSLLRENERER